MYTKLKLTTQYTIWAFVLIAIVAAPISGILWIGKQFVSLPINNQSDLIQKHGIFLTFLMICLIGPCIEEVLFRYPITLERKVLLRSFALGMLFKLTLVLFGKTESFVANIILSNLCWISIILYYARKEYGLKAKSAAGYISMVFFCAVASNKLHQSPLEQFYLCLHTSYTTRHTRFLFEQSPYSMRHSLLYRHTHFV